jgi:hypothetical protein
MLSITTSLMRFSMPRLIRRSTLWGLVLVSLLICITGNAAFATWSSWADLGGKITSAPTVASWASNRLDVFARGQNNHLWHKVWNGHSWDAWEDLGGVLASAPGCVSRSGNRIDCFAEGENQHLWHKEWE